MDIKTLHELGQELQSSAGTHRIELVTTNYICLRQI